MNNGKNIFGTFLEMVGIISLTSVAIKAECERHKTKNELIDTQIKLNLTEISGILKDAKIRRLEKELDELKSKEETEES